VGWASWAFLAEHEDQIADQGERIRNLKKKLAEEARAIEATEASMIKLQVENDQLKLYLAAVVRILIDKGLTSRQDIKRLVELIDGEQGTADGRLKGDIVS
jgi:hypothetical protein